MNFNLPRSRRCFLERSGMGLGLLGLGAMLGGPSCGRAANRDFHVGEPLAPKGSHFPARAKHVIHIFLNGGPSHVDTFDPKPLLARYHGKPLPTPNLDTERLTGTAMGSPFRFRKYGQSGTEVSEIFSHVGEMIDDCCVIRSMQADLPNHEPSLMLMNCGDARLERPSMGSWLTYGLGTENENLPGFIALCPGGGELPIKGNDNWRSAFLPGVYQGTSVDTSTDDPEKLIAHIKNGQFSPQEQRRQLDLVVELNRRHQAAGRASDARLEARIQSFEQAFRMQSAATDAFDIRREPEHIRRLYGDGAQARQLLIARRLVERGVRFVQAWHGASQPWDNHAEIEKEHKKHAAECSQATAALIADLKQRGLLGETLVIFGGEFGRTPSVEGGTGRDHNHYGFSMLLAGGGVRGGTVYGATDEFGWKAAENPVHVHDLHATILHLLGLDHERLTYRYAGRDFRLTDVYGNVVREIIA